MKILTFLLLISALFSSLYHPFVMLGKENVHQLNYYLHDMKQKIQHKDRLPAIESFTAKNGYIIVKCPNLNSFDWVVENAQDQEIKHDIASLNKQFEFNAQIPTSKLENFNEILIKAMIETENPEFNAYAWKLKLKMKTRQIFFITIICDDESVFNIVQKGFKLIFGNEEINLEFVGVV